MTSRGHIAIVGGSIAGLLAGVLLRRAGWSVDIYERSRTELSSRGAGIVVHTDLFDALEQSGITLSGEVGVPSVGRMTLDRDGMVTGERAMEQVFTSWGLLFRLLRRQFPDEHYHLGMVLQDVENGDHHVTLRFDAAEPLEATWMVAADGVYSTLRSLLMGSQGLDYAGYIAWRGLAKEAELPVQIRQQLTGKMSFSLPHREHMLVYLVPGPDDDLRAGHRWFNWVWYRPAAAGPDLNDLLTDDDGVTHPNGIPPPLIQNAHLEAMRAAANALLPPQFQAFISHTERPFLQPVIDGTCNAMRHGRVMFIGDAAFPARPHVGMGVSKAAADANALARAFSAPDTELADALQYWEQARLKLGHATIAWGRRLGSYLGAGPKNAAEVAIADEFGHPETVMGQVAPADPYLYISP